MNSGVPVNCGTDEDEEFLKSNETMKDLTPPKLTPAVHSPPVPHNSTAVKQLYASSPPNLKPDVKTEIKQEIKPEISEPAQRNGLIAVSSSESKTSTHILTTNKMCCHKSGILF